jgi:CHASE2 domain-containing sensor protein
LTSEGHNNQTTTMSAGSKSLPRPRLSKRLLRALPVIATLMVLMWIFGHTGVLHRIETVVSNVQMRLNKPAIDNLVVIVDIDDTDYQELFRESSPLNPARLEKLISDIAKGQPRVIGVDIDTSSSQFATEFPARNWGPHIVWEREVREVPEEGTESGNLHPLDILGGQKNLDPRSNSTGLPLLIDESEDKVTRKYRRSISTQGGPLPSFPYEIAEAYRGENSGRVAELQDSQEDRLIHFSGTSGHTTRLHFSARKVSELSEHWPETSPIRDKIVLLGGSYLSQDIHETPVGRLSGLEVMANVVETELAGGGEEPPSRTVVFLLELFEAFVLILFFHILRFRSALLWSIVLVPVMAIFCSLLAYRSGSHFIQFVFILLGLLLFELYEHFRRSAVPSLYHDITGTAHQ